MSKRWFLAALRTVFIAILLIMSAILFYILVIMGDTTELDAEGRWDSPAVSSMKRLEESPVIFPAGELLSASLLFPGPVLSLAEASGWQLYSITVQETVPEGTSALTRTVALQYYDAAGAGPLTVSSATPAACIRALASRGFQTSADQQYQIADIGAVLMTKENTLHLYAQRGDIVYQIEGDFDRETLQGILSIAGL